MQLEDIGWKLSFAQQLDALNAQRTVNDNDQQDFLTPYRITGEQKGRYTAAGMAHGDLRTCHATLTGRYRYRHQARNEFPAVGDWVAAYPCRSGSGESDEIVIEKLLSRTSSFSRKVPGRVTEEQIVAANIDYLFVVTGLDENYNLRRIERFISVGWDSGAVPVVILNKSDICRNLEQRIAEVEETAAGADVLAISAVEGSGIDLLLNYLKRGKTGALVGSSGAGKTTIINTLTGDASRSTQTVSSLGSRGRHTTTSRELVLLEHGGMIIDTPGMRELQVWGDDEGVRQSFPDIERLAADCRFRDCTHTHEPGCAVLEAIDGGVLDPDRLSSYKKLMREYAYLEARVSLKAKLDEKARWKEISKFAKSLRKER